MVAFWPVLLALRIRLSHFCRFCSISDSQSAFNGRVFASFPLRILPHSPCTPFSCTIPYVLLSHTLRIRQSHFGSFHSLSPFDNRILEGFPPSPHATVAFWQLSHPTFSHTAPAPRSRVRSHFCCLRTISAFDGRILLAFAYSWYSAVAFWHVLLNLYIRRSHFGSFSSPYSPTLPLPHVFA